MIFLDGDYYDTIDALNNFHWMACVAWDRDGISEFLSEIAPDVGYGRGLPRVYSKSTYELGGGDDDPALLALFYGERHERVAEFRCDPVPHWTRYCHQDEPTPRDPKVRAGTPRHRYPRYRVYRGGERVEDE